MRSEIILGYRIATGSLVDYVDQIESWLKNGKGDQHYFICANPHSLVVADGDPRFQQAIHGADLVAPDGTGILLASKILGGSIRKRVTGTDVFVGLNNRLNECGGYSCFFLGATWETLEKITVRMATDFPNVKIAGTYSPPFKSVFSDEDNAAMIKIINAVAPDVLWVGVTAPKQEKWIHTNREELNVSFIGAIGAVFDFYSGNVKRSPPAFQRLGLEWLPRLVQQPRRLWRRNLVSSPLFLWKVLRQAVSQKRLV